MDRKSIIKSLLPGLLPLFVFILADELWGTKTGLFVAVGFGIAELIFSWLKNKHFDKFILFDTVLLVGMGGVSILLENDIFFKLKPALIELILCIVLGISVFSPKNIVFALSKRYMKNISISQEQEKKMVQSLKIFFWITLLHVLLIIYSAYYLDEKAWAFISGGLFYIIIGAYFIYELLKTKISSRLSKVEYLPLVDESGKILGKAPRVACHNDTKLMHPVVHCHFINSSGQILLQKRRSDKLIQPGLWDTAVGGHVSFGETVETSLERETLEELGIQKFIPRLYKQYVWETDIESELVYMFIALYDGNFSYNPDELAGARFWTKSQIESKIGDGIFTQNFLYEWEMLSKNNLVK